MKVSHDPLGIAEGKALLDKLPDLYASAFSHAHLEIDTDAGTVSCTVDFPGSPISAISGKSAQEAIKKTVLLLNESLLSVPFAEWTNHYNEATQEEGKSFANTAQEEKITTRFQSKQKRSTIGVTMPASLKECIQFEAKGLGKSFSNVTRTFIEIGFEDFDRRTFYESSKFLIHSLNVEAKKWHSEESNQVMVRVDPDLDVRIRASAKEYNHSASQFGFFFISHGHGIYRAMEELGEKIAETKGPALGKIAERIGVYGHRALISSVLDGSIEAPNSFLALLSRQFNTSLNILREFIENTRSAKLVPSYKAESGKPLVQTEAVSWEESIKSLGLTPEEEAFLLDFRDK
ncbi:MAG: hypothetical protein P1U67_00875 [Alcanivoracaceae bacterium]|nr:hypothetical protein [Alcanivoracaceae bacterium]